MSTIHPISSQEYMDGCMPPWASCVKCGILMWHDRNMFGCGNCGIVVYPSMGGKWKVHQMTLDGSE